MEMDVLIVLAGVALMAFAFWGASRGHKKDMERRWRRYDQADEEAWHKFQLDHGKYLHTGGDTQYTSYKFPKDTEESEMTKFIEDVDRAGYHFLASILRPDDSTIICVRADVPSLV